MRIGVGCGSSRIVLIVAVLGETEESTQPSPVELQKHNEARDSTQDDLQDQATRCRVEVGKCRRWPAQERQKK